MKKINKKLISSIILGLILYTPVTNVHAAELNDGAIYGNGDNYDNYKDYQVDTDTIVYDFSEASSLVMNTIGASNDKQNAVFINGNQSNITINNKLDIFLTNDSSPSGFYIFNNAQGKTIDRSMGGDITINKENLTSYQNANAHGAKISGGSNNSILLGNSNISITAKEPPKGGEMYGLYIMSGKNNNITMGDGNIIVTSESKDKDISWNAYGIAAYDNGNTVITGDVDLNISLIGGSYNINGIVAANGASVSIGDGDIKAVGIGTADASSNPSMVYGISGTYNSKISKKDGNIIVQAQGNGAVQAIGVVSFNSTVDLGVTDISAQTIGEGNSVVARGINADGESKIDYAGGQINVAAYNDDKLNSYNSNASVAAIYANGTATVKVNENSQNKVVINGDIYNRGSGSIFLNLNTTDSVLNGGVDDANGTFNLANSAQWNVLGESTVNNFNVDNGIINMSTADSVNIGNYYGNGIVSFQAEDVASDGVMVLNTGNIAINQATQGSNITLGVANNTVNTLDVAKTEENLNALAEKISYNAKDGNLTGKVVIKEGLITPEASGVLLFDANNQGYVANITGGDRTTETMYAMKNLVATAIVAWRQEDSTLSQRLGELRDSEDGQGIWVRMSRGEFEYDGEYKNQYNFFQMGYDWAADDWHYGAAISHNDGQTTYTYGDGENSSTSLSLYGTWLGDKGQYADIVLKQGRLSNDFDIYTSAGHTSGDYDAWGTSLSGEYGQKIALEDDWYVTPQAQLTLMRIGGEDYTTNNGINVHQDTLHSAVGRLGFELGKKIADKGSVYAKASLLHDFAGNAETYLSYNGFGNSYMQDISDTWCEAGIGFNYKTGENSYVYADVVKTFGGDVETPWQWNAGMRWSF